MAADSLESIFQAHETDIQQVNKTLDAMIADIQSAKHPDDLNSRNVGGPYRACKDFIAKLATVDKRLRDIKRITLEHRLNVYWAGKLYKKYDLADYEAKRTIVSDINTYLRDLEFAIRHPESGEPCTLLASASPDGKGRYVLSDRRTKKRSHTSVTLLDLLPLRLNRAPRRREAFIEAKEKGVDEVE